MTPTVSMRPTVSGRFWEAPFVDRFHVSHPIGKRGTETVAYRQGQAPPFPPSLDERATTERTP